MCIWPSWLATCEHVFLLNEDMPACWWKRSVSPATVDMVHILLFYKFLYIPRWCTMLSLENNTPQEFSPQVFSIPSTPISESPPGQVRRHISELLTKAKADFREHFGTQLGCGLLGPCSHLPKSMGNPWFGWFGSIDLGGECDTEVNCRCSESETQKNYIMYPISFVSRSFKNQLIDVPMSEVNHVSDYIG